MADDAGELSGRALPDEDMSDLMEKASWLLADERAMEIGALPRALALSMTRESESAEPPNAYWPTATRWLWVVERIDVDA